MKIHNNFIQNRTSSSRGIMGHIADVNNVEIYDNEIDVVTNPLYFVQLNQLSSSADYMINVHDNNFISTGKVVFSNSRGINFSLIER